MNFSHCLLCSGRERFADEQREERRDASATPFVTGDASTNSSTLDDERPALGLHRSHHKQQQDENIKIGKKRFASHRLLPAILAKHFPMACSSIRTLRLSHSSANPKDGERESVVDLNAVKYEEDTGSTWSANHVHSLPVIGVNSLPPVVLKANVKL